ncbi:hypothetical protein H6F67_14085 [Microcoleus sp. FACHB-1515]|uniref:hypothetical protein n=1 Tax=Cyanophyceae TaxID=3028117 RepID=UPI0016832566|nr:hypothetical protein [Microcoleus sp. FACHB-1515]MBD2090981.1 hypothetical protein [Microcoleus sp. FACHB-1515]
MTIRSKQIADLPRFMREALTRNEEGELSQLSFLPADATSVKLFVNGVHYDAIGVNASISINEKLLGWNAQNAGFYLDEGDRLVAEYVTNEPIA